MTEGNAVAASQSLPMEFMQLPEVNESATDEDTNAMTKGRMTDVFFVVGLGKHSHHSTQGNHNDSGRTNSYGGNLSLSARERLLARITRSESPCIRPKSESTESGSVDASRSQSRLPCTTVSSSTETPCMSDTINMSAAVLFATHSSLGVLDLGATKTVIGSEHVSDLIQGLQPSTCRKLYRCPCEITFRFGNQGTLTSSQALVVPVGDFHLKVAIVSGSTPFLISNTMMRALKAKIDCHHQKLSSPWFKNPVPLQLTNKGLFLVDLNDMIHAADSANPKSSKVPAKTDTCHETFASEDCANKQPPMSANTTVCHDKSTPQHEGSTEEINKLTGSRKVSQLIQTWETKGKPFGMSGNLAQNSSSPGIRSVDRISPLSHVDEPATEQVASGGDREGRGSVAPHTGGAISREDQVWGEAPGCQHGACLEDRSGVDQVPGESIRDQCQARTSPSDEVCGAEAEVYHEEHQLPVRVPKTKSVAAPMTSRRQPKCKAAPRTRTEVDKAEISDLQLIESDAIREDM